MEHVKDTANRVMTAALERNCDALESALDKLLTAVEMHKPRIEMSPALRWAVVHAIEVLGRLPQ